MTDSQDEIVELKLKTDDRALFKKTQRSVEAHLKAAILNPDLDADRDVRLKSIDAIEGRGAFDPYFVLGFTCAIAVVGGPIAAWLMAHKNAPPIPINSPEAQAFVEAVTATPTNEKALLDPVSAPKTPAYALTEASSPPEGEGKLPA
jgi:hypothetical protein